MPRQSKKPEITPSATLLVKAKQKAKAKGKGSTASVTPKAKSKAKGTPPNKTPLPTKKRPAAKDASSQGAHFVACVL